MTMNIFEYAVKNKLRFPFKGVATTEDLWDLSVENLDMIFKSLNARMKQAQEESLLNTKTKEDKESDVQIEIVKHIVNYKLVEREMKSKEREKKEQKQKIIEILANKKDQDMQGKSVEELEKMLQELE